MQLDLWGKPYTQSGVGETHVSRPMSENEDTDIPVSYVPDWRSARGNVCVWRGCV